MHAPCKYLLFYFINNPKLINFKLFHSPHLLLNRLISTHTKKNNE